MNTDEKQHPSNHGTQWTPAHHYQLIDGVKNGLTISAIAKSVGRKTTATIAKLKSMIIDLIQANIPRDRILSLTEISGPQFDRFKRQSDMIVARAYFSRLYRNSRKPLVAEIRAIHVAAKAHLANHANTTSVKQIFNMISQLPELKDSKWKSFMPNLDHDEKEPESDDEEFENDEDE